MPGGTYKLLFNFCCKFHSDFFNITSLYNSIQNISLMESGMKKLILLLIIPFIVNVSFPQQKDLFNSNNLFKFSTKNHSTDSLNYILPKFDVHVGIAIVSGGRIGVRFMPFNKFSFEISYGKDLRNFISFSDVIDKYSAGINWHMSQKNNLATSLLIIYQYYPDLTYDTGELLLSPNLTLLSLKSAGFETFIRAGFSVSIYDFQTNSFEFTNFGINLDVGIGWVFP